MLDLVQLQQDIVGVLLSADALTNVPVFSYRQKRLAAMLDAQTLLATGRNGRSGAFVMVMLPEANAGHPNISGPVLDWSIPVLCVEQPDINLEPQRGTLLSAEEIGQIVLDVLHLESDEAWGTLRASGSVMRDESALVFAGCVAYRVTLALQAGKNTQTPRCAPVSINIEAGVVTLTCPTVGAIVRYTLDGTEPSAELAGNPSSVTYTGPFPVTAGTVIRAAAYAGGYNKSASRKQIVTS